MKQIKTNITERNKERKKVKKKERKKRVVSIGGFFSILCSFLYSGILYSIFSCFPFYFSDVIVSQKSQYENESNHSVGGGLFHLRALLTFHTAQHKKVSFIEWLRWLNFELVHFVQKSSQFSSLIFWLTANEREYSG